MKNLLKWFFVRFFEFRFNSSTTTTTATIGSSKDPKAKRKLHEGFNMGLPDFSKAKRKLHEGFNMGLPDFFYSLLNLMFTHKSSKLYLKSHHFVWIIPSHHCWSKILLHYSVSTTCSLYAFMKWYLFHANFYVYRLCKCSTLLISILVLSSCRTIVKHIIPLFLLFYTFFCFNHVLGPFIYTFFT
jgi:hypothetical protein